MRRKCASLAPSRLLGAARERLSSHRENDGRRDGAEASRPRRAASSENLDAPYVPIRARSPCDMGALAIEYIYKGRTCKTRATGESPA